MAPRVDHAGDLAFLLSAEAAPCCRRGLRNQAGAVPGLLLATLEYQARLNHALSTDDHIRPCYQSSEVALWLSTEAARRASRARLKCALARPNIDDLVDALVTQSERVSYLSK